MASNNKILYLLLMDVSVEFPIDTCSSCFNFDSFIRGYHVYQHIWTNIFAVGEKYRCIQETENKQGNNAIAAVHEEKFVGRISTAVLKYVDLFLSLPGL